MAVAVTVPNKFVWSEWATMFMGYTGQGIELEKHCVFGCPHLSLLPSRSKSCGISTYRPSPLSTASQWITRETVGQLWKWSIVGRPPPPTSSVTVNFLSCKWKNGRRLPQLTSYQILSILSIVTDKKNMKNIWNTRVIEVNVKKSSRQDKMYLHLGYLKCATNILKCHSFLLRLGRPTQVTQKIFSPLLLVTRVLTMKTNSHANEHKTIFKADRKVGQYSSQALTKRDTSMPI